MVFLEENFKWHLEAFASELFICLSLYVYIEFGSLRFWFFDEVCLPRL